MLRIGLCVSMLFLGNTLACMGQMPTVTFGDSPSTEVTVRPYTAERFPVFQRVFPSDSVGAQLVSLVLENLSTRKIVGIAIKDTLTDSNGKTRTLVYKCDSLMVPNLPPVAEPHSRILI